MHNIPYYRLELDDYAAASFTSFSKDYFGTLEDIRGLTTALEGNETFCKSQQNLISTFHRYEQGRTLNRGIAERMTHTKALNVLNNCIRPALRKDWSLEEDERSSIIILNQETNADVCDSYDWSELSHGQFQLYRELTRYGEVLRTRLSQVDLEVCDIQHYIEFFALDAAKGYKAYRMLKERLERRRHIKQEMARVNYFLAGSAEDHSSGKVDQQIRDLENCHYSPRILNELFEMEAPASRGEMHA